MRKTAIKTLTGEMEETSESFFQWVHEIASLAKPKDVILFLNTEKEKKNLYELLEKSHVVRALNPKTHPNSYLALSAQEDVARVEDKTFICTERKEDAGITNNWIDPREMMATMRARFNGCMEGRTMYIIPYCMGPVGSPYSRYGVEITDSPYVVANLSIMTRIGKDVFKEVLNRPFARCIHSVGVPLKDGKRDSTWPCNTEQMAIAHFPEKMEVWSFGSGYGGNALLNKKCFALRLASWMARSEGWLAEHMLIIGVTNPKGEKQYIAASFPSQCGKTNMAMLTSPIPGWKVECVGDDIAWLFWDKKTGQLRAINPEYGFFGVAPGTSEKTNPNAMRAIAKNTLFTNVGYTEDGDIWWEGMDVPPPPSLKTWLREEYIPGQNKAAHANSRFTAPLDQCPSLDPQWNSPAGVPISAIIFGGRRATTVPLVREAASWRQGVFYGASMTSETTAAAKGEVGKIRHDPFAMLPFCGYNMAHYFSHWLSQESSDASFMASKKLPKIYYVNWFLKDSEGKFLWPGFSQNMHVIKWIFERIQGKVSDGVKTPVGILPALSSFECPPNVDMEPLLTINEELWGQELERIEAYFRQFDEKDFPKGLFDELYSQMNSLGCVSKK